jgi:hypothetical protein
MLPAGRLGLPSSKRHAVSFLGASSCRSALGCKRGRADSVRLRDSPPLGTTGEEPGFAAAGALLAGHFDGGFSGGSVGAGTDAPNLSPAVISRLTAEWKEEYTRWQKRDLSARHYVYAWADGVYLQARMEEHSDCMLVLLGATPEGKKELIGFQVGVRESAQSWRELLVDLKSRGLSIAPEVAVGDGPLQWSPNFLVGKPVSVLSNRTVRSATLLLRR